MLLVNDVQDSIEQDFSFFLSDENAERIASEMQTVHVQDAFQKYMLECMSLHSR